MTERAFAPADLTAEEWDELLRLAEQTRGRLTPRDLPAMSADEFRRRRQELNPPLFMEDYEGCDTYG